MATVSFDGAESVVNMTDPNLVAFGQAGPRSASFWSWTTPGGDEVQALGFGMQFDAAGRATAGTVTEVRIDAGNDNAGLLDIHASGLPSLPAAALDDSAQAFWNAVLGGSDTIDATGLAAAQVGGGFSILFGDDLASVLGSSLAFPTDEGGNDAFTMGDGAYDVMGDAARVAGNTGFRLFADYLGGDDTIAGGTTGLFNRFVGDAGSVGPNGRLGAGNDEITVDSSNLNSEVAGDTGVVLGSASGRATVVGGDDTLEGGSSSEAKLVGDAIAVDGFADVSGGDDFILDGDRGNELFGDVLVLRGNGTSTVRGGDDAVLGRGGNDRIAGDAGRIEGPNTLVGGDDALDGGDGNDTIFGEVATEGALPPGVSGGNDAIFGGAGNDRMFGQTGEDTLSGGAGRDGLFGGDGNDRLEGGGGKDTLDGGADVYVGGGGADVFVFQGAFASNVVLDFQDGSDRFDLAAGLGFGDLAVRRDDFDGDGLADDVLVEVSGQGSFGVLNTALGAVDASDFLF
jgi:hemolysin type calcium-binding protein